MTDYRQAAVMAKLRVSLVNLQNHLRHTCYINEAITVRESIKALDQAATDRETHDRVMREIQRLQPTGSPAPGGPAELTAWIVRAALADRERLEQIRAWATPKGNDGLIRETAKGEVRAILGDPHE